MVIDDSDDDHADDDDVSLSRRCGGFFGCGCGLGGSNIDFVGQLCGTRETVVDHSLLSRSQSLIWGERLSSVFGVLQPNTLNPKLGRG